MLFLLPTVLAASPVRIDVEVPCTVEISAGTREVAFEGDSLNNVTVDWAEEVVRVVLEKKKTSMTSCTVKLKVPAVSGVRASSAADVRLWALTGDQVEIRQEGAASVQVASVEAERLAVELEGAAALKVTGGTVKTLDLEASGAASAGLFGLASEKVELRVEGASSVEVNVSKKLSGKASGASTVRYRGAVAKPDVSVDITSVVEHVE